MKNGQSEERLAALAATMFISVKAMAYSLLVTSILSQFINSYPNRKLLDYHYGEQLKDMLPQILLSCMMGGIVFSVTLLHLSSWIELAIQIPLGIMVYVAGSILFKIESYQYVLNLLKKTGKRLRPHKEND